MIDTIQSRLTIAVLFLSGFVIQIPAQAFDFDVTEFENELGPIAMVTLDESHDLVRINEDANGDIDIFMFDPSIFDEVPNTLDWNLLEMLASTHESFEIDGDDVNAIGINCLGGDDIVLTDPSLPMALMLSGGDGDDTSQRRKSK